MIEPIFLNVLSFQQIVECAPNAMIIVNNETKIAYLNTESENLFGYTKEDLIGKTIDVLIPTRYLDSHFKLSNLFIKVPKSIQFGAERNLFGLRKDGTEFPVKISLTPLATQEGTWILASVKDISNRKKYEEQRILYSSIVNSSNDAIVSKTLNGIITSWNNGAESIFGYAASEIIGKHISILIPKELQNEETEIINKINRGETVEHYETERIHKNGNRIQVSINVSPIKDFQGNIIGASKISRDITENKEAAARLEASQQVYRNALDNMLEGIQIHDFDWKYTYVNNAYLKYRNYSKDNLIGHSLLEVYPGLETTLLFKTLNRCMKERVQEHLETEFAFPDGKVSFFELSIQPVPEGLFILSIDITQRKKDEEKINKVNRLYSFISHINQCIVHIKDRQTLFEKVCEIALEIGKFKFAWIGMVNKSAGRVNLVAHSGITPNQFSIYENLYYKKPSFYLSPLERAITTGTYAVSNDVHNDIGMKNFKEQAKLRDYNSVIILPLKLSGKPIAAFCCTSSDINFFDKEEINLLLEAAGDISFALDVFEKEEKRLLYEKKLEENELSLKEAQEVAAIGSWEHNYITDVVIWSEEQCRIFGLPIDQTLQSRESFLSFIHPEDAPFVREEVMQAQSTLRDHSFYCRIIRRDGILKYIFVKSRFKFDKDGAPIGIYGISHDVTEIKKAEIQLKRSEAFSKGVLNALTSHIAVIDNKGVIISTNDVWKEFSIKNGEHNLISTSEGSNYYEVCEKSAKDGDTIAGEVLAGIKGVFDNEIPLFYLEYPCHSPVEERWFAMQAIKFESDEPMVIVSHQNITARKLAEFELLLNNSELKKTNSELDRFVYSVSHELRMPLTSIMGLHTLINKTPLTDRDKGLMELIRKSVYNMDDILREILDYSRNTRIENSVTLIDLSALIDNAFDSSKFYQESLLFEKRVNINTNIPFYSDLLRIKIIINNLISNALKYCKKDIPDAFIEVKMEVTESKLTLEVRDNGIGINKEYLPNIFKMFYRATSTVTGSGLGLYIVKESIEKLGGSISVESELNIGTKFIIELPNAYHSAHKPT